MGLMLVAAVTAAIATLGGALAARQMVKARKKNQQALLPAVSTLAEGALAESQLPNVATKAPSKHDLQLHVGDVIQNDMATRWPQSGLLALDHDGAQLIVLFSEEANEQQATVAFAAPDRTILWLTSSDEALPRQAPSCIEVGGALLQRSALLALTLEARGDAPDTFVGDARIAIYDGPVGEAALLLDHPNQTKLWHGVRLDFEQYERLANVPDS